MRGVILGPGEGVSVANPVGGALTFKIGSAETDGALTAFESISVPCDLAFCSASSMLVNMVRRAVSFCERRKSMLAMESVYIFTSASAESSRLSKMPEVWT